MKEDKEKSSPANCFKRNNGENSSQGGEITPEGIWN